MSVLPKALLDLLQQALDNAAMAKKYEGGKEQRKGDHVQLLNGISSNQTESRAKLAKTHTEEESKLHAFHSRLESETERQHMEAFRQLANQYCTVEEVYQKMLHDQMCVQFKEMHQLYTEGTGRGDFSTTQFEPINAKWETEAEKVKAEMSEVTEAKTKAFAALLEQQMKEKEELLTFRLQQHKELLEKQHAERLALEKRLQSEMMERICSVRLD